MATKVTLTIPDTLASQLGLFEDQLPEILELGLREWNAAKASAFEGIADVLEMLAALPSPEEVLALRPSEKLQARIDAILEKNRTTRLDPEEERQWQQCEYVEHLVRKAKAKAVLKLKKS